MAQRSISDFMHSHSENNHSMSCSDSEQLEPGELVDISPPVDLRDTQTTAQGTEPGTASVSRAPAPWPTRSNSSSSDRGLFMEILQQQKEFLLSLSAVRDDNSLQKPGPLSSGKPSTSGTACPPAAALGTPPSHETNMDESSTGSVTGEDPHTVFEGLLSSDSNSDEEDDPLAEIQNFFDREEELAAPLSDKTAKVINSALHSQIPGKDQEKVLTDSIKRPENCTALAVPKINREIWTMLKRQTKENDLQLQRFQFLLHKGLTPLVTVLDKLKASKDKVNLPSVVTAFRILTYLSCQISQKRKAAVAPDLAFEFRQICATSRPITDSLFGDDLPKVIKDIRETTNMGQRVVGHPTKLLNKQRGKSRYQSRPEPYSKGQRKSFLGHKAAQMGRKKGQQFRAQDQGNRQSPPPARRQ